MKNQTSMLIRAQELRAQYHETGRVPAREIAEKIYAEFHEMGDQVAIDAITEVISKASKTPPVLPEQVQDALFTMNEWVTIQTPDGPEFVEGEMLTTEETEAFVQHGIRHHSAQLERYKRARRDVKAVKEWEGFNPAEPYNANARRYLATLNAADHPEAIGGEDE